MAQAFKQGKEHCALDGRKPAHAWRRQQAHAGPLPRTQCALGDKLCEQLEHQGQADDDANTLVGQPRKVALDPAQEGATTAATAAARR